MDENVYKPTVEQAKLVDRLKAYAKNFHKSEVEVGFHEPSSPARNGNLMIGSIQHLQVSEPGAVFYRSKVKSDSEHQEVLNFIQEYRALFLIDDEGLRSIRPIESDSGAPRFQQVYKNTMVYNGTLYTEVKDGVSKILNSFVPTAKLKDVPLEPVISPEKVVQISWKDWFKLGSHPTLRSVPREPEFGPRAYTVFVTRTRMVEGKSIVEEDKVNIALIIYTESGIPELAWCFGRSRGLYSAMTGELLWGEPGFKTGIIYPIERRCPY